MKQETLNLIANIDENTVILPKSEGGAFEMYQMDTIADLRKTSRNFMRTEKILENIDAKTSTASETVAGIVTEARIKELSKALDPIQATETVAGIIKIATQSEVNEGIEDTKIVTSKKLKARLDSMLAGITSTYVKLTQLATETVAGITKIATQSEVNLGADDSKIVTSKKLNSVLKIEFGINASSISTGNGYIRFGDGTQICFGVGFSSTSQISSASAVTNVFPISFTSIPTISIIHRGNDPTAGTNIIIHSVNGGHNELNSWKGRTTYPTNIEVEYIAVGRWK